MRSPSSNDRSFAGAAVLAVLLGWAPDVRGDTLTCPATVRAAQKALDPAASWTAVDDTREYPLRAASFTDGPPQRLALLKPGSVKRRGKVITESWRFEGDFPEGRWLSCAYLDTTVQLARRIPDGVTRCTVTYERNDTAIATLRTIDCE